ncbi:dockerin type I domain-containing protein [Pseudobacteroides cellulosolvens]|uniref:Dockerin domain-containing protein n=1 Tax=Pseudobacteroides cellulosolvens ATCC 35603 = DSM 2933 TaxID=398512 RepID=A0A0L6JRI2_9FIRM|nr:dockerin type I domain-containing protein [Pseudobacteroides cellulosolvens]KNY28290.1 hypothetical protein Bccel_3564 [Pseudobacteroides cellulosolvens ATCC 35603 = DSM 2933]
MKLERLIILLILSTIAFSLGSLSILKVKASEAVYGDFDKDNDFDSDDYALLRQFLLGMIAFELAPVTADVDGNSRLDSDDYAYMKQHLLGMINKFPVETREEVKSTLEPTPKPSGKIKGDLNKDGYY